MFGFYLDLPKNYEPIQNLNLNQLIEENPSIEVNRDLINEIGNNGRKRVKKFFNWNINKLHSLNK